MFHFLIFVFYHHLGYLEYDEYDESDKEKYEELGSESSSAFLFGAGLGGLLYGIGLTLGATLAGDGGGSWNGDGGSLDP